MDGLSVLKKVAVTGGPAVTLATLDTAGPSGATWGPDDTIIVATNSVETGLQRVAAAGGPLTVLTRPDRAKGEADHFWPEMLPGGRAVLFTITALTGGLDAAQVAVLDLQTGTRKMLVRGGSHAHYVSSGHLVYLAAGALQAVPFDVARLETHGTPVPVVTDVETTIRGAVLAVVADDGTLAYVSGSAAGTPRTLVWVDREGHETPIAAPPRPYFLPALSPDGTRVAVFANDQERDLWLWDLGRTTLTRLTFTPGVDVVQVWTPDSRRLIFTSERAGVRNLFWQAADGSGAAERLTESPNTQYPTAVSPDGRRLVFADEIARNGHRRDDDRIGRDPSRDAARAVPVHRAERDHLARRPLARLRGERLGPVRNLCAAIPGREQRSLAGVHQRRHAANLDAERAGADLCLADRCAHGGGRGARPIVGGHDADAAGQRGILHDSDLVGPVVRCFTRRPAVPDDQRGRRRWDRCACEHHRRAALGRGAEATRADEIARCSMALSPGTRLGPYEIQSAIGAGGMGEVYKARDTRLDRTVAIKILPEALAADPQFRDRFDREARTISQFTHPNICTLYDVGEHAGTSFLVMELLDGETLENRCARATARGSGLPLDEALRIAIQMADALAAAHRQGIVHRDLKPGNIFLARSSGASAPPIAKLLDFGLARTAPALTVNTATMMPTTPPQAITAQGTILGTFQYMAPEQVEGGEADARTDIFAFGSVLYEMITGKKAFEGKTQTNLVAAILERDPPPLTTGAAARAPTRRLHRPQVPGEKPGRPLADRVRFGIGPALGRGRREREPRRAQPQSP